MRDAVLAALGERLGTDAPRTVAEALCDPAEPHELGLAVSLGDGPGGALLSYNPRVRGGAARGRMLRVLAGCGIDPTPAEQAFALVPDARSSTVLGVEWRPRVGGPPAVSATLYLEEVSRFFSPPEAARRMRALARLVGVDVRAEARQPGPLYIWALDLSAQGPTALKVYRLARADQGVGVRAAALRHAGGALDAASEALLFGGVPASAWIVQRRHARGAAGAPAPLKIYKCYPYQEPGVDLTPARAEVRAAAAALGAPLADERVLGLDPTSVGLRFAAGAGAPVGGTAYGCLALNR
jgi:hypothetical protein